MTSASPSTESDGAGSWLRIGAPSAPEPRSWSRCEPVEVVLQALSGSVRELALDLSPRILDRLESGCHVLEPVADVGVAACVCRAAADPHCEALHVVDR